MADTTLANAQAETDPQTGNRATETADETGTATEQPVEAKTYTQEEVNALLQERKTDDEVNAIVKQRLAREKAATEKAIAEAEKLAKMDAAEKAAYEEERRTKEHEEVLKKLAELEQQNNYNAMSKQAATMLSEENIAVNDAILSMVVVAEDAEQTQANIKAFSKLVKDGITAGVKDALKGETMKASRQNEPPDAFAQKMDKYK